MSNNILLGTEQILDCYIGDILVQEFHQDDFSYTRNPNQPVAISCVLNTEKIEGITTDITTDVPALLANVPVSINKSTITLGDDFMITVGSSPDGTVRPPMMRNSNIGSVDVKNGTFAAMGLYSGDSDTATLNYVVSQSASNRIKGKIVICVTMREGRLPAAISSMVVGSNHVIHVEKTSTPQDGYTLDIVRQADAIVPQAAGTLVNINATGASQEIDLEAINWIQSQPYGTFAVKVLAHDSTTEFGNSLASTATALQYTKTRPNINFTTSLTNVTATETYPINYTGSSTTLHFTANSYYTLPSTVTISYVEDNVTKYLSNAYYTWVKNGANGILTIAANAIIPQNCIINIAGSVIAQPSISLTDSTLTITHGSNIDYIRLTATANGNTVTNDISPSYGTTTTTYNLATWLVTSGDYTIYANAIRDNVLSASSSSVSYKVGGASGYTVSFSQSYYVQNAYYPNGVLTLTDISGNTTVLNDLRAESVRGHSYTDIAAIEFECSSSDGMYYTSGGITDSLYIVDGQPASLALSDDLVFTAYIAQSCIAADTLVLMADGTQKQLGQIHTGEYILSYDWNTMQLVPNKVIYACCEEPDWETGGWDAPRYFKRTFSNGTVIKQAFAHRFYNREEQRFVYMEQWKLGQHTYAIDPADPTKQGELVAYVNTETVHEPIRFARITGENGTNYFANGLLTGDRHCPRDLVLPPQANN